MGMRVGVVPLFTGRASQTGAAQLNFLSEGKTGPLARAKDPGSSPCCLEGTSTLHIPPHQPSAPHQL